MSKPRNHLLPRALVFVMLAPLPNLMAAAGWNVNNIDVTDGQDEARTVFCKGETVKLTVTDTCSSTAERSYSWSPGGSTNNPLILTNLNSGNYIYTVTVTIGGESGQASAGFTVVQVASISTNSNFSATTYPIYVGSNTTIKFYAKPSPVGQWPAGKPAWGGVASGSGSDHATVTFNTVGTNYVTAECGNTVTATVVVVKVEMVTPAGDPVNSAVQSGDGQNEFTYSTASPGVLTMNLKAHVTPNGVANQITDKVLFTVDSISGSTMTWDAANPGGKPTASGDDLLATVRFTGLPANNTAFGSKKAAVYYDGQKQDEESYEVFYPRDTANHPGGQSGSLNWFYYWSQAISANNVTYSPGSSLYGECPGMLHWSYSTSQNKDVVIVYDTAATEDPGDANADHGKKATTGIDTFEDTYLHEHYHTVQIDQADNVVGVVSNTPWQYGWSWNQSSHNHWSKGTDGQPGVAGTDDDTNGTTDDLIVSGPGELGHGDDVLLDSGYDWPQAFGSLPSTPWAGGGPIEDQAYNQEPDNENARASVDWGDPGKQHKTLNKYDD